MPIIPTIGRRTPRFLSLFFVLYLLLAAGAGTMLYPFLMTLTASVSNEWDYERYSVVPRYLMDRRELYAKFLAEKYLQRDFSIFASAYRAPAHWKSFRSLREDSGLFIHHLRLVGCEKTRMQQLKAIAADYAEWVKSHDVSNTLPLFDRFTRIQYQDFLRKKYENVARLNEAWGEGRFTSFDYVNMDVESKYPYHLSQWLPPVEQKRYGDYTEFLTGLPATMKCPITAQYLWAKYLESTISDFRAFRERSGLNADSVYQVSPPSKAKESPSLDSAYADFLQQKWPLRLVRLPRTVRSRYLDYAEKRFGRRVAFHEHFPLEPQERVVWREFAFNEAPPAQRILELPEELYRNFLRQKYVALQSMNSAYGWSARSYEEITFPIPEIDYAQFMEESGYWRNQFLTFNFRIVFKYMAVQGRSLFNTLVVVSLTVLGAIILNPLAAYALVRFKLRQSQQVLLFCLATMAFPAEIVMIPNFLLLRELDLLNTFAALLLPGLVSGFSIFLLKGFFQSIPQELYEAATMDGANEPTIFMRIIMPLSKPILAYLGLMAFISAYSSFMWPFLVAQDEKMWTLMVWVYQFQALFSQYPYMIMAAFVLVSIPTLLAFLFCQDLILRGITIPTMK
ncbi:MAG: carbohydrate ABC transporter permease [Verrucomicrobia bacterium]|nr:carbohydrate ABC transporter permease [Verrucomicrobiota bacterium]